MADQQDPSKLTDEELAAILGEEPQEEEPETPKTEEENPSDETEETEEAPEEESEEESEQPESSTETEDEAPEPKSEKPSRREQLRIKDLLAKYPDLEEKRPETVTPPEALDYEKALEADPDVLAKLKEDRDRASQAAYQKGLEEARSIQFHTRLEIDAPRVEAEYPQLDKESDKFNPALADAVNQMYLSAVGWDPKTQTVQRADLRYRPYVQSVFELANEIAGQQTQEQTKKIVKNRSNMGLRPDGGTTAKKLNLNKAPEAMTDEELDAIIAQAVPSQ